MKRNANLYNELKRVFHEPKRLAIVSELCTANSGLTFNELKEICETSDGNLHRHLKMLEMGGIIAVEKEFVDRKPRTTVYITEAGIEQFLEYLDSLATVLQQAQRAAKVDEPNLIAASPRVAAN